MSEYPPEAWCPICHHPHLDYLEDEPCVSCGCEGPSSPGEGSTESKSVLRRKAAQRGEPDPFAPDEGMTESISHEPVVPDVETPAPMESHEHGPECWSNYNDPTTPTCGFPVDHLSEARLDSFSKGYLMGKAEASTPSTDAWARAASLAANEVQVARSIIRELLDLCGDLGGSTVERAEDFYQANAPESYPSQGKDGDDD